MPKAPAIFLYPGDWLRDSVAGCSFAAQGLWLRMMYVMHDSERYGYLQENGGPMPPDRIARRCGGTQAEFDALYLELETAGVPSKTADGIIYSRRMVRDDSKRKKERKRQQNHRDNLETCHERVTPLVTPVSQPSSSSSSSSSSKPTEREEFARESFERFWSTYPKQIDRDVCFRLWLTLSPIDQDKAAECIPTWVGSESWAEQRFIPNPETFLMKHRWESKPVATVNLADRKRELEAKFESAGH